MAEIVSVDQSLPAEPPIYAKSFPFLQRFRYSFTLRLVQLLLSFGIRLTTIPLIRNPVTFPTITKTYPSHPALSHRIFIPKSRESTDTSHDAIELPPLYIDIHGGGFAWTNPVIDDPFCSNLANKHNIFVVSVDYPKAPTHRFPAAINTLVDLVLQVLKDEQLHFDRTKVAIGGFSAGANLAFAVCQDERMQGNFKGVVAFYPPVNFTVGVSKEMVTVEGFASILPQDQLDMFSWGYVDEGQDLTDPRISPTNADRARLPPKMFIVGCELDSLCSEAEKMAVKMAAGKGHLNGDRTEEVAWEKNGVRWEKVLGEDHAFDMRLTFGAEKTRMRKRAVELHQSVAEWLLKEVYL